MSVEGFYGIQIGEGEAVSTGMTVFDTQNIYGGDSAFMWRGTYLVRNGMFYATVQVRRYSDALPLNIFNTTDNAFEARIAGEIPEGGIASDMQVHCFVTSDIPGASRLPAVLAKVCDLP
jgi:hypothetical protein